MADKLMRAVVTIPLTGGVPEDFITNTFYFDGDDGNSDAEYFTAVQTLLTDFYQAIDEPVFPASVDTPATVKIYDMRDPEPRLPEGTFNIALDPTASAPFPGEVALCLSFQAAQVSGVNPARRRGRVYIGPINSTGADVVSGQNRPNSAIIDALCDAAAAMENGEPMTVGSVKWAVYSPTTDASSSIDDAFNDVVDGWVDNSWDTQRRRGTDPSSRTTWT